LVVFRGSFLKKIQKKLFWNPVLKFLKKKKKKKE